ncbi:unnamed protein product [Sphenostylis stenocarpa]|uniref:Uncharacterized protein n=1 Tax=Sphenostylis stenocarpa TaxID=92480 RepID=A0AA86S2C3_9FABA|nr:unnamed protein product [Sphenostylis stenocarpa]
MPSIIESKIKVEEYIPSVLLPGIRNINVGKEVQLKALFFWPRESTQVSPTEQ